MRLDANVWKLGLKEAQVDRWINQFRGDFGDIDAERELARMLLSNFMFFGALEITHLCRSLFRDHYQREIVEQFRRSEGDTLDVVRIEAEIRSRLFGTRFIGLGNPAESGTHLLYAFRTANDLPIPIFTTAADLQFWEHDEHVPVERVVILDDLCGSGFSATGPRAAIVAAIRDKLSDGDHDGTIRVDYLTLFATKTGLDRARESGTYDTCQTAMIFDESYTVFGEESRYFSAATDGLDRTAAKTVVKGYGKQGWAAYPLGYRQSQMLLGLAHNIPNNTLPVFWATAADGIWLPLLKRHAKIMNMEDY